SIIWSGGNVFTVTTSLPHGRANNDCVLISGAMLNGSTYNSFNGSYQISNVSTNSFQYTPSPVQPNNAIPTGNMWLGRFPSQLVQITNVAVSGSGPSVVTVTTATAHFLVPGRTAVLHNISVPELNGPFQVSAIVSRTQFTFSVPGQPATPAIGGSEFL